MTTPNDTTLPPVIFKARGMEIDTRLEVFGTIFHVSSAVLKMHSQYFFKFLVSADKVVGTGQGGFKYDWVTKIVDDGKDWQLVAAGTSAGDLNLSEWKGGTAKKLLQQNAFHNILKAMYVLPYVLDQVRDLLDMTSLARFYMCLPVVSRTLDGALVRSHNLFQFEVQSSCLEILPAAIELRHKALFKDSLIYSLGPLSSPEFNGITDKKIKRMAQSHYHKLRSTIYDGLQEILSVMTQERPQKDNSAAEHYGNDGHAYVWLKRGLTSEADRMDGCHQMYVPRFFRAMLEDGRIYDSRLLVTLDELLRNDLKVGISLSEAAGIGSFEDYFLFTTIEDDDDYPWDMAVDDW